MAELFKKKFEYTRITSPGRYIVRMLDDTYDDKLYIARHIDEDISYITVYNEEDMNCVSVVTIYWDEAQAYDEQLPEFLKLYRELEEKKSLDGIDVYGYIKSDMRKDHLINRMARMAKFFEIGAPEIIMEGEKLSLLEEFMFNRFAERYVDVVLYHDSNVPEAGSRAETENKAAINAFLKYFEKVIEFAEERKSFSASDIEKELKTGYSHLFYILDSLEYNGVLKKEGKFWNFVEALEDETTLEINASPYDKDTVFIDEMTPEELARMFESE